MAGALNMLVTRLGVIPVVPETFSSQGAGEAAWRCSPGQLAPHRHGVSVVAIIPCLLRLCVLCMWDAELLP